MPASSIGVPPRRRAGPVLPAALVEHGPAALGADSSACSVTIERRAVTGAATPCYVEPHRDRTESLVAEAGEDLEEQLAATTLGPRSRHLEAHHHLVGEVRFRERPSVTGELGHRPLGAGVVQSAFPSAAAAICAAVVALLSARGRPLA